MARERIIIEGPSGYDPNDISKDGGSLPEPKKLDSFSESEVPAKKRVQFVSAHELAKNASGQCYVVKGIIPEGITIIYGASGSGKSFIALQLALAIAGGKEWPLE